MKLTIKKAKPKRKTWAEIRPLFQQWCYKKRLGNHNMNGVTQLNMGYAFEAGYRAAIRELEAELKAERGKK